MPYRNAQHALTGTCDLNLVACTITVCLASVSGDQEVPEFRTLQLSNGLGDEFRDVVRRKLASLRRAHANGDLVFREYDPGSKPDDFEVEYVMLSDEAAIQGQFQSLSTVAAVPVFENDDDFIKDLRFYVIIVQPPSGDPVYFFRLYGKSKELGRSSWFGAFMSGGAFDRVREPMFLFDQQLHCMATGDWMCIFNKDSFQKIFRFFEQLRATARETLETIREQVPITNFEELQAASDGHLQMQAKLKNIARKPYLRELTMTDVKRTAEHFRLNVSFEEVDGEERIVFDENNKWEILRLLDDDYLTSTMTEQDYEVTGKRPHSTS